MGLKVGVVRIDGEVKKKVIAQLDKPPAIGLVDERSEVFGPENNGVHPGSRYRNNSDVLIKRIDDLKKAPADLLHKPGHVKGRDIGPSGGGDDDFGGRFHLRCIFMNSAATAITKFYKEGVLS